MKIVYFALAFLLIATFVSASSETSVYYFHSIGCPHCAKVHSSGVLDKASSIAGVKVYQYEVRDNESSRNKFFELLKKVGVNPSDAGVPFVVIEKNGKYDFLMGDREIIGNLERKIKNFNGSSGNGFFSHLTLGVVVVSALIDSINPCAFGILLFLMAVLLSMGSSKRALRAGIIYSFVIFFVYLGLGLGLIKLINSFSIIEYVRLFAGVIVLIGAVIEIKDFFFEGKGISLKIPAGAKPLLEKYIHLGTLPAVIVLGIIVTLVELPCTGGIYLAILSLVSNKGLEGYFYLVIYNLIFILPLIVLSFLIYNGTKVEALNKWTQGNKRYMRLAEGIIMALLGLVLLKVL